MLLISKNWRRLIFLSSSPLVIKARDELLNAQANVETLKLKYGSKHPKLIQGIELVAKTRESLTDAYASTIVGLEGSWRAAKTNLEQNKEKLRVFTEQSIKNKKFVRNSKISLMNYLDCDPS